jgi:hypothetical protein
LNHVPHLASAVEKQFFAPTLKSFCNNICQKQPLTGSYYVPYRPPSRRRQIQANGRKLWSCAGRLRCRPNSEHRHQHISLNQCCMLESVKTKLPKRTPRIVSQHLYDEQASDGLVEAATADHRPSAPSFLFILIYGE